MSGRYVLSDDVRSNAPVRAWGCRRVKPNEVVLGGAPTRSGGVARPMSSARPAIALKGPCTSSSHKSGKISHTYACGTSTIAGASTNTKGGPSSLGDGEWLPQHGRINPKSLQTVPELPQWAEAVDPTVRQPKRNCGGHTFLLPFHKQYHYYRHYSNAGNNAIGAQHHNFPNGSAPAPTQLYDDEGTSGHVTCHGYYTSGPAYHAACGSSSTGMNTDH